MLDVLATLSQLVKVKKPAAVKEKKPKTKVEKIQPIDEKASKDMQAQVAIMEARAREMIIEAKDEVFKIRTRAEDEVRQKLEVVDRKEGALEEREKRVQAVEKAAEERVAEIEKIKKDQLDKLERVANLTLDDAKQLVMKAVRDKLKAQIAKEIKDAEAQIREEADKKAREILVDSMKHGATDYVAEYTVSIVKIQDEDIKGRVIGKEGRNIRAFETATGVDVDLDEEGVIRLSSFDPVRREIARVALEKLIKDGRVQPGRIEEIVAQVKREIERIMFEEGQKLCHSVGVYNLPAPLVALLGRFKYRSSYGQNMIAHTLEETKIGISLAQEVGADANIVRLGCLLHDIGKVIMDKEGSHVDLGVEILSKYKVPKRVIDCVAQHHEDKPFTTAESMIVYIADAISGSRPGARYEDYEEYIKRLHDLEEIAKSNKGVDEAFAFQAGRELRVVVDPGKLDDESSTVLAHKIKEEIEKKLTYPGTVKVTVIRELRTTEVAK